MSCALASLFRRAAPFRLAAFMPLAEGVLDIGQRVEFAIGQVLKRLYHLVGSPVLAGVLRELAGVHWGSVRP